METTPALWLTLIGLAIICVALVNALLRRIGLPGLVGYILIGFAIRLIDQRWPLLSPPVEHAFSLLASIGVVALLFRIGLESNPRKLMRELPQASVIGVGNLILSGLVGYYTTRLWLGFDLVPSLTVAAALVATSVGVSLGIWEEADALDSRDGRLLLDIAELDDIAGVILMGLLLSVLPILLGSGNGDLWKALGSGALLFLLKFSLFTAGCLLFARHLEGRLTTWSSRFIPGTGFMLLVVGLGFVIAAIAGWLGFSLAIGALFAGLAFSRDPKAVNSEASFNDLHAFFTPFFFIGIGLDINPEALAGGLQLGMVLLLAAVVGKLLGGGLPAWPFVSGSGAVLIGVSMIPRAEIAMIVMHQGKSYGPEVVPDSLYTGMVVVTAATSVISPLLLRPLIARWRQT